MFILLNLPLCNYSLYYILYLILLLYIIILYIIYEIIAYYLNKNKHLRSLLVYKHTILTELSPVIGEVNTNICM
jgi:hypothetical protein